MQAKRIATGTFDDDFNACTDKTVGDLEEYFKSYSVVTVIQGQIGLNPETERNTRVFLHRNKDTLRLGKDPAQFQFTIADATELIQHLKTRTEYIIKSKRVQ